MRMFLAVSWTVLTTFNWWMIEDYVAWERQMRREYSPEVLALAHVNLSVRPSLIWGAVIGTVMLVPVWYRVISEAEKS